MPVNFALTPDQLNGFQADQWAQKANAAVADAWQARQVANLQPMPVPAPPSLDVPTSSDSLTRPMQAAPQPAPLVGTVPEGTPSTDASQPPPEAPSAPPPVTAPLVYPGPRTPPPTMSTTAPVTAPLVYPGAPPPTQQPISRAPSSPDETISSPFGEALRQLQGVTQPQAPPPPPATPVPSPGLLNPDGTRAMPTPSDSLTNPIRADPSTHQTFVSSMTPLAQQWEAKTGIPAAYFLAVNASESNWGNAPGNELFGIKAPGNAGSQTLGTWESEGGQRVNQDAGFGAYATPNDAYQAFVDLISTTPRYASAWQQFQKDRNPDALFQGLNAAGYATDPNWGSNIASIARSIAPTIGNTPTPSDALTNPLGSGPAARTSQFDLGLSAQAAYAACGPAAAIAFANTYGRYPTPNEAMQLASSVGWTADSGMAGVSSEQQLLGKMGIPTKLESTVDWNHVAADAANGNPVILDTPGHYFYVSGVRQGQNGLEFNVGTSGTDLKGGGQWMSAAQINGSGMGSVRAALYADNPTSATPSVAAPAQPSTPGPAQQASQWMTKANLVAGVTPQTDETISNPFGEALRQAGDIAGGIGTAVGNAASAAGSAVQGALGPQPLTAAQQPTPSDTLTNPPLSTVPPADRSTVPSTPGATEGPVPPGIPIVSGAGNLAANFGGGFVEGAQAQQQARQTTPLETLVRSSQSAADKWRQGDIGGGVQDILAGAASAGPRMANQDADLSVPVATGLERAGVPSPYREVIGQLANLAIPVGGEAPARAGIQAVERGGDAALTAGLEALDRASPPSIAYASTRRAGESAEEYAARVADVAGANRAPPAVIAEAQRIVASSAPEDVPHKPWAQDVLAQDASAPAPVRPYTAADDAAGTNPSSASQNPATASGGTGPTAPLRAAEPGAVPTPAEATTPAVTPQLAPGQAVAWVDPVLGGHNTGTIFGEHANDWVVEQNGKLVRVPKDSDIRPISEKVQRGLEVGDTVTGQNLRGEPVQGTIVKDGGANHWLVQRPDGTTEVTTKVSTNSAGTAAERTAARTAVAPDVPRETGPVQILGPRGEVLSTVARSGETTGIVRSAGAGAEVAAPSAATVARMPNIAKLAPDMPEVAASLQRVAEENPHLMDEYTQGRITHRQLINELAPELGMTAEEFLKSPVGKAYNPQELLTLRAYVVQKRVQATRMAADIVAKGGVEALSPTEKVKYIAQLVDASHLQAVGRGGASTAARSLNQQKIVINQEMAQAITGGNEARAAAKALEDATRAQTAAQTRISAIRTNAGDRALTAQENVQLAAQIKNERAAASAVQSATKRQAAAGDVATRVASRQTEQAGRLLEKMGGKKVTDEMLKQFVAAQQSGDPLVVAKFLQSLQHVGWWDRTSILRYASMLSATTTHLTNILGNTVQTGLDVGLKPLAVGIDAARAAATGGPRTRYMGEIAPQLRGMAEGAVQGFGEALTTLRTGVNPQSAGKLENVRGGFQSGSSKLDAAVEMPLRALEAADLVFRGAARGGATRAIVARRAIQEGYTGQALRARMDEIMQNLPEYPAIMAEADKTATRTVLQEPNALASAISSIGRGPGPKNMAARIMRELVVPFTKTPANLLAQGLELSPAGAIDVLQHIRAGDSGGAADAGARVLFGSSVMAGAAALAAHGFVTGGYPADPKERDTLPTGWQPWSLKIPDGNGNFTYVDMSKIGTPAIPFAIGAVIGQSLQEGSISDPGRLAGSLGKFMTDQTFLQGLNAVVNAMQDPKRYGENVTEQLATSFVPYASFARQMTRALGQADRNPKGAIQAIEALIPGVAENVPRRQNALGQDIQSDQTGAGAFISPLKYSTSQPEPILNAFRDVGMGIPSAPTEIRVKNPLTNSLSPPMTLTEAEKNTYQQKFGELLQQRLNAQVSDPNWQRRTPEARKKVLEVQTQAARDYAEAQVYAAMAPTDRQARMAEGRIRLLTPPATPSAA